MFLLAGLVGLLRTIELQLIGRGIDLDFHDIEWFALEIEIILSFLRLYPSTAFQTLLLTIWLLHFFQGIPARSSRYNGHLS